MMGKLQTILILWATCIGVSYAHNANDISYFFNLDTKELNIYLTPKSAVDLLKNLHAEIDRSTLINLSDYTADFETYFNEKLGLNISGTSVEFKLTGFDLNTHDASLHFALENLPKHPETYQIKVESFLDVYEKGKNYVSISAEGQKHRYAFNNTKIERDGTFKKATRSSAQSKTALYLSLVFAALSVGFTVYRKNNIGLNHHSKPKSY
ncbi:MULTISPECIES: DUF6702 family protein [Flavobacteriaceae]|uniref:DUF6702 family protein n=1 Tax=Flavobacteriaceae TaxID=49546 RepID=UPI001492C3AB|nr:MULTISPECIES: DUF6702 family protein [Allomuricauda]MDC6365074.1 hypothetical protein [Muricauda sp. AC10]